MSRRPPGLRPRRSTPPPPGSVDGLHGSAADTDAAIGSSPAIHLAYFGWEDHWATSDEVSSDLEEGRIPLVNWEPFGVDFAGIVRGDHDGLLAQRAAEAATLERPVFVDFAAEMNEEEGWGGHDPELYKSAYEQLHTLGKPIIIGETASAEEGGSQAEWIADIPPTLRGSFPDIRALVWFDVDKERDWRIRSSEDSLATFRDFADQ
ncbi:hypothetical protein [Herbiconiux sp.]|uniref:hypothetical protein n=1 Tax=Herbiconiux sp. TaxID=1871186 RepID=UPI0025BC7CF3|nr:hypothetical protein [Herbiconiux sp.]